MKIIISPAKIMKENYEEIIPLTNPLFYDEAVNLRNYLKSLDKLALKNLYNCNDKILEENLDRFMRFTMEGPLSLALTSYDGLQYKHLSANIFTLDEWNYVNKHLAILSGLYGVLRPSDGIIPYRLEMQAEINYNGYNSLYDFWGDKLYQELYRDDNLVLNLASKEYSLAISKHLKPEDQFVTCIFATVKAGKLIQKATEAKSARGEMVSFLAKNNYNDLEDVKKFQELGFKYNEAYSDLNTFVFTK